MRNASMTSLSNPWIAKMLKCVGGEVPDLLVLGTVMWMFGSLLGDFAMVLGCNRLVESVVV